MIRFKFTNLLQNRILTTTIMSWDDIYYNTTLYQEALKYTTRIAFKNGSGGAYQCALRRSCLNEIYKHMNVPKTKWSKEMFETEALN